MIHEHPATSLAYDIFKDIGKVFIKYKPTIFMFLDLGVTSYTCDISSFEPGKLTLNSARFDKDFGGRDFGLKIAKRIAVQFEAKYKREISGKPMDSSGSLI